MTSRRRPPTAFRNAHPEEPGALRKACVWSLLTFNI
jgi:hypothetical protein